MLGHGPFGQVSFFVCGEFSFIMIVIETGGLLLQYCYS
jgi:hypothetical protein